jgi:hypothetical protein
MHILMIACSPVAVEFIFKTKETAEANWNLLNSIDNTEQTITDDFGKRGKFKPHQVSCSILEDCDVSKRGYIERSLHKQRADIEFQKAAESDLVIRSGMRGPPMLSPMQMFNGRGN